MPHFYSRRLAKLYLSLVAWLLVCLYAWIPSTLWRSSRALFGCGNFVALCLVAWLLAVVRRRRGGTDKRLCPRIFLKTHNKRDPDHLFACSMGFACMLVCLYAGISSHYGDHHAHSRNSYAKCVLLCFIEPMVRESRARCDSMCLGL